MTSGLVVFASSTIDRQRENVEVRTRFDGVDDLQFVRDAKRLRDLAPASASSE
jgi:hypothetical protein